MQRSEIKIGETYAASRYSVKTPGDSTLFRFTVTGFTTEQVRNSSAYGTRRVTVAVGTDEHGETTAVQPRRIICTWAEHQAAASRLVREARALRDARNRALVEAQAADERIRTLLGDTSGDGDIIEPLHIYLPRSESFVARKEITSTTLLHIIERALAVQAATDTGCRCMTEDPGDGWGERVVTHSSLCPLHPEADA